MKQLVVPAEAWSDCGRFRVKFDAERWLREASEDEIVSLSWESWGRCYEADAVAMCSADWDSEAAKLFKFIELCPLQPNGDANGFECVVDEAAAREVLADRFGLPWILAALP